MKKSETLTAIEQETVCLCDELRAATPADLEDWITFIRAWFETDDEYKGFRQQMREALKKNSFQYPDFASPVQPSGKFMDFYGKNDAIALAILREWASIAALKAIPFPVSSAPLWDRWLEEIEKDGITTYEGITDEEFAMYFGGRRTKAKPRTAASKAAVEDRKNFPVQQRTNRSGSEVSRRGAAC